MEAWLGLAAFVFGMGFMFVAIGAAGMGHEEPQDSLPMSFVWRGVLAFAVGTVLLTISAALVS